jgi:hypothetical protein
MSQSRSVRGKSLRSLCALVILLSAVGCVQSPDPWRPDARNVDGSLDGTVADARGTVDGSPQPDLPDATDASTPADLFPADVPSDLAADLAQDLSVPDLSPELTDAGPDLADTAEELVDVDEDLPDGTGVAPDTVDDAAPETTVDILSCTPETVVVPTPVMSLLLLLDRSASMDESGKWGTLTNAVKAFLADPASDGHEVALNFFPDNDQGKECSVDQYDPPEAAFGMLPGSASGLTAKLDLQQPTGQGNPMWGALKGSLTYAGKHVDQNPEHRVGVLMAADGDPYGCPTEGGVDVNKIMEISGVANAAWTLAGTRTYTMAIGDSAQSVMNAIAAGGGTAPAYTVTGTNPSETLSVLNEVRDDLAAPCERLIPEPPEGKVFSPAAFGVQLQDGESAPVDLVPVAAKPECGEASGWYFDNPEAPLRLHLCPASCALLDTLEEGQVLAVFGCPEA